MAQTMQALVRLEQVSWQQDGLQILKDVSLSIWPGKIVTVIGPNGAGKSSLVNLVIGLHQPTSGRITLQPRLRVGYMPQHLRFDGSLPISVGRFLRLASKDPQALARQSERLGVGGLMATQLQNLSGGELQRVLLTRALLRKPQLLVLDEPTQGVDVMGQSDLYRIITEVRDELGCGVLMVSHDLHLVMARTDIVICLNHHICCHGEPETVGQHPEFVQLFGAKAAEELAVYTHHHDHQHDLHGNVIPDSGCQHHDH